MKLARYVTAVALACTCLGAAAAQADGAVPETAPTPTWHQAQVEARIPFAPQVVPGSDGARHLAYELRLTSFQDEDNPLTLTRLDVFIDAGQVPLSTVEGADLHRLLNRAAPDDAPREGLRVASGRSLTLFLWLKLPAGTQATSLRHQVTFRTAKGDLQRADDVRTRVVATAPIRIAAPLRGGRWLAVEGPGNALSHHWGGMVAIDGTLSIPQRFAIDWFGLDAANHSLRSRHEDLTTSVDEDWIGFGQDVLAVADGVVVDARDGIADGKPLRPLEGPDDLTARTLYGNFVVLRLAPGIYAHYAHLRAGSVQVRAGQRVKRGATLAQLGQTGSAGAPHLHFHLSDRPTFEHSQGLPFVVEAFSLLGQGRIEDTFDPTTPSGASAMKATPRRNELPLDGSIVSFPR